MTTTRDRIVAAAARLLDEGGPEGMSTRAVSAAAGVQAPTIYRLFGDKQGLLDAVTLHRFEQYLAEKTDREPSEDPVDDLRRGFDGNVGLGLASPTVYRAIYGGDAGEALSSAARRGDEILLGIVRRIAAAGRLRLDERTAAAVTHAAARGVTLGLISTPEEERDLDVVTHLREAVIAAVTTDAVVDDGDPVEVAARTVRAALPSVTVLSPAERTLMDEWLDRIAHRGLADT